MAEGSWSLGCHLIPLCYLLSCSRFYIVQLLFRPRLLFLFFSSVFLTVHSPDTPRPHIPNIFRKEVCFSVRLLLNCLIIVFMWYVLLAAIKRKEKEKSTDISQYALIHVVGVCVCVCVCVFNCFHQLQNDLDNDDNDLHSLR